MLSKDIIENLPNLKYIGVLATGYNVVDAEVAEKAGVTVTLISWWCYLPEVEFKNEYL